MNEYELTWIMAFISMVCYLVSFVKLFNKKLKFIKYILRFYAYFCAIGLFFVSLSESDHIFTILGLTLFTMYTLILLFIKQRDALVALRTFFSGLGIITKSLVGIGAVCILGYFLLTLPIGNYITTNTPYDEIEPVYFENCTDAFSKGYSNINVNEPGYSSELDRDDDGIACER